MSNIQNENFRIITRSLTFKVMNSDKDFKPRTLLRGKPRKKAVEKPRDDVYFLADQEPPKHNFTEALEVLRAYAFTDEAVAVSLLLNMKMKKVW